MRLLAFSTLLGLLAGHCSAYVVHPKDTKTIFETQQLNLPYVQQKVTQSKPCKGSQPQKSPLPRDVTRKKWGIDKDHHEEYWFNKSIHTLGNTGFFGAIHAAMAPTSTRLIDLLAYNGVDIRAKVAQELAQSFRNSKVRVLDIACGVGFSTRALRDAFPKAELVVGIDTSPEMIQMARLIAFQDSIVRPFMAFADKHMKGVQESIKIRGQAAKKAYDEAARSAIATFQKTNAEHTPFPSRSFDLVTIMYAFHEAPYIGRQRILQEVRRLLHSGGTLALIDIASDYTPSKNMLAGEPYVQEYQKNIHRQLNSLKGFSKVVYKTLIPGHVGMWILKRV